MTVVGYSSPWPEDAPPHLLAVNDLLKNPGRYNSGPVGRERDGE